MDCCGVNFEGSGISLVLTPTQAESTSCHLRLQSIIPGNLIVLLTVILFETHFKPDLSCTRESIGNFNETQVPRGIKVNIYRRICRIRALQVCKGDF